MIYLYTHISLMALLHLAAAAPIAIERDVATSCTPLIIDLCCLFWQCNLGELLT